MNTGLLFVGGATPGEAFGAAQEEARHTYGHNGATGTIAEAPDFEVVPHPALLDWSAMHAARTLLARGRVQDGGPALLVPVAQPLTRKNVLATVDVTDLDDYERNVKINDAINEKIGSDQSIYDLTLREYDAPDGGPKGRFRTRPYETKMPPLAKDKRVSFNVYENDQRVASFATASEARKFMKARAKETSVPCRLVVRGETTRLDGGPLFVAGRNVTLESVYVKARVALHRQAPVTRWVAVGSFRDS